MKTLWKKRNKLLKQSIEEALDDKRRKLEAMKHEKEIAVLVGNIVEDSIRETVNHLQYMEEKLYSVNIAAYAEYVSMVEYLVNLLQAMPKREEFFIPTNDFIVPSNNLTSNDSEHNKMVMSFTSFIDNFTKMSIAEDEVVDHIDLEISKSINIIKGLLSERKVAVIGGVGSEEEEL